MIFLSFGFYLQIGTIHQALEKIPGDVKKVISGKTFL